MKYQVLLAFTFLSLFNIIFTGNANQWKSRTIYQVLTDRFAKTSDDTGGCNSLRNYCGGTYRGLTKHLDYIQGLGFDAIWISPIVKNYDGGYHGYWMTSLYELNTNFGSEADLKQFISECHKRNIWVMVDVVANHVGPVGWNFGTINPFNQASHYHDCTGCPSSCNIENFNDQAQVEKCRLAALPDLNQTNQYVKDTLNNWIRDLVQQYNIDGLRIDTVPEIAKDFWVGFQKAAGCYAVGEVFDGRVDYLAGYQRALDAVLSYPLYFTLNDVFMRQQSMYQIESRLKEYSQKMPNVDILGTFLDNHDNARFLNSQGDNELYKNAITFVLLSQGIPIIYYGTEQGFRGGGDPENREVLWTTGFNKNSVLYKFISTLNAFRKNVTIWNNPQIQRYADDRFYAFTRGKILVCLTNGGSNAGTLNRSITYHPYTDGTKLCNLFYPSDCVTVTKGAIPITLLHGESKVFYPV